MSTSKDLRAIRARVMLALKQASFRATLAKNDVGERNIVPFVMEYGVGYELLLLSAEQETNLVAEWDNDLLIITVNKWTDDSG